jgi:hypothetical protein
VPANMAVKVLCDRALPGAAIATKPKTTNISTTALAVRFIGVSCFFRLGAFKRAATVQGSSSSHVARQELLGIQSRNRGNARIRRETHGQRRAGNGSSRPRRDRMARNYCGPTSGYYSRY